MNKYQLTEAAVRAFVKHFDQADVDERIYRPVQIALNWLEANAYANPVRAFRKLLQHHALPERIVASFANDLAGRWANLHEERIQIRHALELALDPEHR